MSLRWQTYKFELSLFPFVHLRSSVPRRLISLTLLVVFAVGMVGLPVATPRKARIGRFPCENCPCGCLTAEFCWDKCCCHSDVEKLRWAEENNVTPPQFLVARVNSNQTKLVCKPVGSCCCSCSQAEGQCDPARDDSADSVSDSEIGSSIGLVILEDAAKCRGIDSVWTLLSNVVVETWSPLSAKAEMPFLFLQSIVNEHPIIVPSWPDPPVP